MPPQSGWFHNNAEQYQDWQVVNDKSVNPVPATATPIDYAADGSSMTLYTVGPNYAGWLAKKAFALGVNLSSFILTATDEVWASPDALNAEAWEFDDRVTDLLGNVYPCDCNFNLAKGGMFQSVAASGSGWLDTGFAAGLPPVATWTTVGRAYAVDTILESSKMVAAWLGANKASLSIASNPALPLNWGKRLLVKQRQIDENANGQTYGLMIRNSNAGAVGVL